MKRTVYILGLLLVLAATSAYANCGNCGMDAKEGAGEHKAMKTPEAKVAMLQAELGLSEDQVQKIKPLVEEKMAKIDALREEHHQKKEALSEEYTAKIKAILSEEQAMKFEEWKKSQKSCPLGCGCPKCQAKKAMSGSGEEHKH
ncbi:MAG: hypothetical protein HQL27_09080 [Candidatus Omnitrophica bacterium]|nr:hypothetical protein [Candidatus Omnitrophota bacterium]